MDSYEGVERLRIGEVVDPQPGPEQVLLRVRFAALNPADAFLAQALYPARPPLSHILAAMVWVKSWPWALGWEKVRVGESVGILHGSMGVEVWGTLAEKVVVPTANIALVPQGRSVEEMAGAPLVFLTAWQALTQWSDRPTPPPAGSVLLVTDASGGVRRSPAARTGPSGLHRERRESYALIIAGQQTNAYKYCVMSRC